LVAPVAVSVAVCPAQMVGEFTVTARLFATVTVDVAVAVHPAAEVPVTV
jgi:ribosomal protein L9